MSSGLASSVEPPPQTDTAAPAVDETLIHAHVEMLHRAAAPLAGRGKLVLVRFNAANPKQKALVRHFDIGDVDRMTASVKALAAERGHNVYIPLAVMRPDLPTDKKGGEADIVAMLGLVGDFDDERATEYRSRLPLPPDYSLESSRGRFQASFLFDQPATVADVKPVAELLVAYAGCDSGTKDLSHVWRIGGTANTPNPKKLREGRSPIPQPVRLVQPWTGSRTKLADLAAALRPARSNGADPEVAPAAGRTDNSQGDGGETDLHSFVASLPDKLRSRIERPAPEGQRSTAIAFVITSLVERGLSDDLIERVLTTYPVGQKFAPRNDLRREIERLRAKREARSATTARGLIVRANEQPYPILANVITILKTDPAWRGVLVYNAFTQRIETTKATPWEPADAPARPWEPEDDLRACDHIQHQGVLASLDTVIQGIEAVARETTVHPVRDYLHGLTWDRTRRLNTWLMDYLGAGHPDDPDGDKEDHERLVTYLRSVGAKTLIGACSRVFRPGEKLDTVLILEGPQGTYKSSALRTLAGDDWFTDHLPDLGSKDAALQIQGKWIVELGELDNLTRSEVSRIKQFLATPVDRFRPPYGRRPRDYPRQVVFTGTINPGGGGYLRDETGNRRFWPVRCGRIDLERLKADRDQLWAEAFHRYRRGEAWWLTDADELATAEREQRDRLQEDPWQQAVGVWLQENGKTYTTITELLRDCLGIRFEDWDQPTKNRLARILVANGWTRKKKRLTKETYEWRYIRPSPKD